jgi:lysophospholipase L1-like esterase
MAEVVARKPARLLISIGANDGVWLMGFRGYGPDTQYPDSQQRPTTIRRELAQLVQNMKMIAELIPAETKNVYWDYLPPPSRTANMNPIFGGVDCDDPAAVPHYFQEYQPYVSDSRLQNVDCRTAKAMDAEVEQVNRQIEQAMRSVLGNRLKVVDLYSTLMKYDHKDSSAGATLDVRWGSRTYFLDNNVIHSVPRSGGIQGYDNMHPSPPTYAEIADLITGQITNQEHLHIGRLPQETPQTVTDELRNTGMPTAINIGGRENGNLILLHSLLEVLPQHLTRSNLAENGAACVLVHSLGVMGHGNRVTRQTVLDHCKSVAAQYRAAFH